MTRPQRILAAVAAVAGLVLAPAKAHATGGEDTDGFLNAVTAAGIPYADRTAMLYVGNDICGNILAGKPAIPPAPTSILGPQDDFRTDAQQAAKGAQLPPGMSGWTPKQRDVIASVAQKYRCPPVSPNGDNDS
jgi:hypothetical protein